MRRALVALLLVAPAGLATAPAGAAPAYSGPCHAAVDAYWPAQLQPWAHAIVQRESRGVPTAVNRRAVGHAGHASGCFQMLPGYARPFLRSAGCSSLLEPNCSARAAYALYRKAGARPWRV